MREDAVAVADFSNPMEAELARNRLETEGIPAFVVDASAAGVFSGMGIATVRLYVPEGEIERARYILASPAEDPLLRRMNADLPLPGEAAPAWSLCPKCGSEVSVEFDNCPFCQAAVATWPDGGFPPVWREKSAEEDEARDRSAEKGGPHAADLAERAWRSAIFGLITLPVLLHAYSFWLLLRLAFGPADASRVNWKKGFAALFIDLCVFFGVAVVLDLVVA